MFESIKKWFKRPIVINFTVEPLSTDATFVLKHEREITPEIAEALSKAWSDLYESKVIVIGPGVTLEQLSDEQLKAVGLMRVEINETTTAQAETTDSQGTETSQG